MNVIVICLDTLRYDYLGCYGNDNIRTPFVDKFSQKAVKFNSAFIGSFPTIPMRVDVYTGCANWPKFGWKTPDSTQKTLQEYLREAGFLSCLIYDTPHYKSSGLCNYFDEHYFINKPVDDGVKPEQIILPFPKENTRQDSSLYILDRVRTSHYRYESDWFVSRTMIKAGEWLEDNYKRDGFFLWVDTFEIHEDWNAPKYYIDMYSKDYEDIDYSYPNYGYIDIYSKQQIERLRARYKAEVTLTDKWVGYLLQKIEDMDLLKNTMVVITSDHGIYLGEHNRMGKHTVIKEDPWPLYDEVCKIPLLVYTPWYPTKRNINTLVEPADLMPTFLETLNVKFDRNTLTGRSILPELNGMHSLEKKNIYSSAFNAEGPGRISYLLTGMTVTSLDWTLIVKGNARGVELYRRHLPQLKKFDCAEDYPEIVKLMLGDLISFMKEQGAHDEFINNYVKGCIY